MTRTNCHPTTFHLNANMEQKMNFRKLTRKRLRNRVKPVWGRMRLKKHTLIVSNNSGRSDNDQLPPYHLPLNASKEQKMIEKNISHKHLDKRVNPIWDDYNSLIEQAVLYQDVYYVQDLNKEMEKAIHIAAIKENKISIYKDYDLSQYKDCDLTQIVDYIFQEMKKAIHIAATKENKMSIDKDYDLSQYEDRDLTQIVDYIFQEMKKARHIADIKENKISIYEDYDFSQSKDYDLTQIVDKDIEFTWNKFYGEAA